MQLGIVDPKIAQILASTWDDDARLARRVDLERWRDRSWWHRLQDRLAYTLNEQL